jgi:2'-5' RNA ligase
MEGEHLYMLAVMPPPELTRDIERIRTEFADKYRCVAALKPPVHITLIPPYKAAKDTEAVLITQLEEWGRLQIPFPVTLENYSVFNNNGVVFISVSPNDLLQLFQKDLRTKFLSMYPLAEVKRYTSFHPHITIGYRDIPPEVFPVAAKEYLSREFFATFVTDRFYLWRHNTKKWEVIHSFGIGNRSMQGNIVAL